jgi:outer membrane receptor protein involved in Fe transport
MSNLELLKNRLSYGTASALIAAMGLINAPAAIAQDDASAEDDDNELEEVIVTGSRIRRSGFETTSPVISLDRELLDDRNFTNVADLLNETPAFGAPTLSPGGEQNGFGLGANVVNFLGLGSARTLTVVNGRRFVSSTPPVPGGTGGAGQGLQVDFNVIPIALVDRIETLILDGAPTYGSDGIAGVINVILKDDFEGFEIQGLYGVTDTGDADRYQVQSVFGGNFADGRGNVAISFEYNTQNGLRGIDRPQFRENNPFTQRDPVSGEIRVLNPDGAGRGFITQALGTFGGISINGGTFLPTLGAGGGTNGEFFEFDAAGNVIPFQVGTPIPGSSAFFANGGSGSDLFDDVGQILTEAERINIGGIAHYDVNDYVTAFAEFQFQNSEAIESSQQDDILAGIFAPGGPTDQGAPQFSIDNPFLSEQARATLAGAGATTFGVNRFLGPVVGGGENFNEAFTWRVVGGLRGDFEAFDTDFSWEVSAVFGQVDLETQNIEVVTDNLIQALNVRGLTQADLDAAADGTGPGLDDFFAIRGGDVVQLSGSNPQTAPQIGDIVCEGNFQQAIGNNPDFLFLPPAGQGPGGLGNDENRSLEGCVPLNLFGNQFAPEAAAFVSALNLNTSDLQQRIYEAAISTSNLFSLPGGDVGASINYVNRTEEGTFVPGGFAELALGQGDPTFASNGRFDTNEIGVELSIPIIGPDQIPFVDGLVFDPKVRYVDNSISGTDYTYTLGGRLDLLEGQLSFRGGYTQSIRSPGIGEIFDPTLGIRGFVGDPCDSRNVDAGPDGDAANANRRVNCEAIGIDTTTFLSNAVNLSIAGQSSGNLELQNEVSDSYSVGVVIQPDSLIPGLQISADYINVAIADRISNITQTAAIQACFDADPSDFPQPICDAHVRGADNQIVFFTAGFQNASLSQFEAVQGNLRYDFDVADAWSLFDNDAVNADYGQFSFRANVFRRITNVFQVTEANQAINTVGQLGQEKWSANFDFLYTYEKLRVFWRMNFTDAVDLDVQDRDNFIFFNTDDEIITQLGDRWVHNLTVSYQFNDNLTVTGTMNNVFDRRGSVTERAHLDGGNAGNGNVRGFRGLQEALGRNFTISARVAF